MKTVIHELSAALTNQIAAGEVIERPASVVKELCENAIDAGSTRLRVEVSQAGLDQIEVLDNGSGIAADQIDLAFRRHATSKITTENDLFKISTLGFRGEALASIASVSHVTIVTGTGEGMAVEAHFSEGRKQDQNATSAPEGTKITVRDLFYNTPARLKYLRSPRTEIMKIIDIVDRLAFSYPKIAMTLISDQKVMLQTVGNGDPRQVIANVYGRRVAEQMIPISGETPDFKIVGLISPPEQTRASRQYMTLLLNGRYVKNQALIQAILAGYGTQRRERRFPIAVVKIALDPLLVDVNVHPTKQEVRLSKEKQLCRLLTQTISSSLAPEHEVNGLANLTQSRTTLALDQLEFNLNKKVVDSTRRSIPEPESMPSEDYVAQKSARFIDLSVPQENQHYLITSTWQKNVAQQQLLSPFSTTTQDDIVMSSGDVRVSRRLPWLHLVGQTTDYLVAEAEDDLYLIDQVAAQRRLAFDRIFRELSEPSKYQQVLLEPITLDFGNVEAAKLKIHLSDLQDLGVTLSEFGEKTFLLRAYPMFIKTSPEQTIRKWLDWYLTFNDHRKRQLQIKIASWQAEQEVPQRKKLTAEAGQELLKDLGDCQDPYHDASGDLIFVRLSQLDLQKMFKKND